MTIGVKSKVSARIIADIVGDIVRKYAGQKLVIGDVVGVVVPKVVVVDGVPMCKWRSVHAVDESVVVAVSEGDVRDVSGAVVSGVTVRNVVVESV